MGGVRFVALRLIRKPEPRTQRSPDHLDVVHTIPARLGSDETRQLHIFRLGATEHQLETPSVRVVFTVQRLTRHGITIPRRD